MQKITSQQCKAARGLLKWNIHDLAHRLKGIKPKRIESFEVGTVHLLAWENDEMVGVFKKAGIEFREELSVVLNAGKTQDNRSTGMQGEGARIVLDADQSVLSDTSADKTTPAQEIENLLKNESPKQKGESA